MKRLLFLFLLTGSMALAQSALTEQKQSCVSVQDNWMRSRTQYVDKAGQDVLSNLLPKVKGPAVDSNWYEIVDDIDNHMKLLEQSFDLPDALMASDPNTVLSFKSHVLAVENKIYDQLVSIFRQAEKTDTNKDPNQSTFADRAVEMLAGLKHQPDSYIAFLREAVQGPSLRLSDAAARALSTLKLQDDATIQALLFDLKDSKNRWRDRANVTRALGESGTPSQKVIDALVNEVKYFSTQSPFSGNDHSDDALDALVKLKPQDPKTIQYFIKLASTKYFDTRKNVFEILGQVKNPSPEVVKTLLAVLNKPKTSEDCDLRVAALHGLGNFKINTPEIVQAVRTELVRPQTNGEYECSEYKIKGPAQRALRNIDPDDAVLEKYTVEKLDPANTFGDSRDVIKSLSEIGSKAEKYCPNVDAWTSALLTQKNNVNIWDYGPTAISFLSANCKTLSDSTAKAIVAQIHSDFNYFGLRQEFMAPAIGYLAKVRPFEATELAFYHIQRSYDLAKRLNEKRDIEDYKAAIDQAVALNLLTPETKAFLADVIKSDKHCDLRELTKNVLKSKATLSVAE